MNGSNTGTSGTDVASIGSFPAAVLPGIIEYLEGIVTKLKSVEDGDSKLFSVDFMEQAGSDHIPDDVMREIQRRLVITAEKGNESNLILSPTEPTDHSKAWQQTDPVTGIPVGQYKIWSSSENKWVVATPGDEDTYTPPLERFTRAVAAPGSSTVNVTFEDIKTNAYTVLLTPTTYSSGSYLFPPNTLPDPFGYVVTNKTNTSISIAFYGQPNIGTDDDPVGVSWDVWIRATPAS